MTEEIHPVFMLKMCKQLSCILLLAHSVSGWTPGRNNGKEETTGAISKQVQAQVCVAL